MLNRRERITMVRRVVCSLELEDTIAYRVAVLLMDNAQWYEVHEELNLTWETVWSYKRGLRSRLSEAGI